MRHRGFHRVPALAVLALVASLAGAAAAHAQATLATDKPNYSPGDTVHITGAGWTPGEYVALQIWADSSSTARAEFVVVADAGGLVRDSRFVIQPADTGVVFFLEGEGHTSKLRAELIFIDGETVDYVSLGPQSPDPVTSGSSATYTVTVRNHRYSYHECHHAYCHTEWWIGYHCHDWHCHNYEWCAGSSVPLSVPSPPSGTHAYFYPQTVYPGGYYCEATATLSMSTDRAMPTSDYYFTVQAGQGNDYATTWSHVSVAHANEPPVTSSDYYYTDEDDTLDVDRPGVLQNDRDYDGDGLQVFLYSNPSHGSVTLWQDGEFTYTPIPNWNGTDEFYYRARDEHFAYSSPTRVSIIVRPVNDPPVLATIPPQDVDEMSLFTWTATATDPDLPPNSLTYSLTAAPYGMRIEPGTGRITWTPTEDQGPYDYMVQVRVLDDASPPLYDQKSFVVHVHEVNLPPTLASIPDQSVNELASLTVRATATDPDVPENYLTYALTAAPPGMRIDHDTGVISWEPAEAQGPGSYTVTVIVSDNVGPSLTDTESFTVHVNEINLRPTLAHIPDLSGDEMTLLTFIAVATDPDLPANGLTFSLMNAADGMNIDPATGTFAWTPTEEQGPLDAEFTVKVTDNGVPPMWDEQVVHIHVNEANRPPALTVPASFDVDEGATIAFTATATDPDVPANTLRFALAPPVPPGAAIDPVTGVFSWVTTHEAALALRVQVSDGAGGLDTKEVAVVVDNVAPTVTIINPTAGSVYAVGENVMLAGGFTDPGTGDTHTALWTLDGSEVPCPVDDAAHTAVLNHAFTAPGVYVLRLTVTDDGGAAGVASTVDGIQAMVVIYDPNAGFVTGGGWIESPPGAYVPVPALTGRASFGFVSRYQRGTTTPGGETEFQFKVASLNFHSTAYQWLTVGGAKAQYKGSGTINGAGDYGFVLTCVDGDIATPVCADKLRMRIWERASGAVVYDNLLSAPDTETPTTELAGGSIVVHTGTTYQHATDPVSMRVGETEIPVEFALLPLAPNPFRGSTQVTFDLPEASRVTLAVHDVAGREVAGVAEGTFEPGRRQLVWRASDRSGRPLEPGVYFARFEARSLSSGNGLATVRKLVLVR